jgi:hypothetical protein
MRPVTSGLWYRANLTAEQMAGGHVNAIRDLFAEALTELGEPAGACLFVSSHDSAIFFSPVSVSAVPHLIAAYGATPSPPPDREHAALLVGTQDDWELVPRSTH